MIGHYTAASSVYNAQQERRRSLCALSMYLVENRGLEPLTPALPAQCSTTVVTLTPLGKALAFLT